MNLANIVAIVFIVLMTGIALAFLVAARRLIVKTFNEERAAQTRQSNTATIYIIRGYARRDAGDYAEAIADFQKALSLQPNHPDAPAVRDALASLQK